MLLKRHSLLLPFRPRAVQVGCTISIFRQTTFGQLRMTQLGPRSIVTGRAIRRISMSIARQWWAVHPDARSDRRYGQQACTHLRAWFVSPATRMHTNLLYAQAVQRSSTGRSYGIIATLHPVEVARAASFLMSGMLDAQDAAAVKSQFASYLDWLSHNERTPGLLFSGVACHEQRYIDLWTTLDADPTDKEIIRNYLIRQPLLWL